MDAIKTWTTQQLKDYVYDNSKQINSMTTIEYNIFMAARRELKIRVLKLKNERKVLGKKFM